MNAEGFDRRRRVASLVPRPICGRVLAGRVLAGLVVAGLVLGGLAISVATARSGGARESGAAPPDELAKELEKLFERKSGQISDQRRAEIVELVSALNKDSPEMRQRTREDLLPYGKDATPFLLKMAGSPSHDESRAALVALAMIRDPESVPYLEAALAEREHFVTLFAALALGELGMPSSVAPLTTVLLDADARDAFDRAAAAVALARLGAAAGEADADGAARPVRVDAEPLRAVVREETDVKVVSAALMALGKIRDRGAVELVLEKAASSSDRIRRAAVLALGDLADPKAEAVLLERIREDEDEATVRFAAGAASVFSDPDVRDVLLATLDRPGIEDATRAVVLRALGAQPPSEEIENRLLRAARGADVRGTKVDPVVRAAALASLRSYDGPAVVKTLVALLPDEDPATRSSVVALLARLGHDEKGFLRLLERFLGSEDRSVVETSALALARLRGAEAKPALARIRETHRAYPFVRNVLAGLEREDADAYFRAWIDEWVEWLGGTSEALRRNLSNAQLFELFELDRRLIKGAKPGDTRPRIGKALSTAQQDLRLWFEYEPYFDPVP